MKRILTFALAAASLAGLAMMLAGCSNGNGAASHDHSSHNRAGAVKSVNTICPIMREPVSADAPTREFKGQVIGFCCAQCPQVWDQLSDTEKQAKLDAATGPKSPADAMPTGHQHTEDDGAAAPAAAAQLVNARCPIMGSKVSKSGKTREFQGNTVGFCCPMCLPAWDKLTDAEKQAKLDAAVAKGS